MVSRDADLQVVLDLMCRSVAADPRRSGETERTLGIVEERLRLLPDNNPVAPEPIRLPVCALLGEALSAATPLLDAFRAVEPRLSWQPRKGDAGDERFKACHANTMLVGPGGLESRSDLWVGATLMAPNTSYPVHHHPPQEIYLVLSEGEWWKQETGWFSPGPGGTVHNCPDALHAFRSVAKPLLALWALPI